MRPSLLSALIPVVKNAVKIPLLFLHQIRHWLVLAAASLTEGALTWSQF
jgi:hypothetical protein